MSIVLGVAATFFASPASAQQATTRPVPNHAGEFMLRVAPRFLQKDPRIDMSVITEMTEAGRRFPVPKPGHPIYCVSGTIGSHDEGEGDGLIGVRPTAVTDLKNRLDAALGVAGYLPVSPHHPATIALIFHWGSANDFAANVGEAGEAGTGNAGFATSSRAARQALVARAALVGGNAFAKEFAEAMMKDDLMPVGLGPLPSAVEEFMNHSYKNRQLVEEARADCFYVVASAFDANALAHGKRVLLWRTKMTTNSQGIAMADALPTLIRAGTDYFGRDMKEAETLTSHLIPLGKVEVGRPVRVPDR